MLDTISLLPQDAFKDIAEPTENPTDPSGLMIVVYAYVSVIERDGTCFAHTIGTSYSGSHFGNGDSDTICTLLIPTSLRVSSLSVSNTADIRGFVSLVILFTVDLHAWDTGAVFVPIRRNMTALAGRFFVAKYSH
jgi:hypothetical protein